MSAFHNVKRPIKIKLWNNKIDYLNKNVFLPLLLQNVKNAIDVSDNAIVCDCRMKWIIRNRNAIKYYQIRGAKCINKNNFDIWALNDSDFECEEDLFAILIKYYFLIQNCIELSQTK